MDPRQLARLRRKLSAWYRANGRHDLPWRHTRDPYAILVSEVMLQQTQVARVLPYYSRWLTRWPDLAALAAATPAEVITEWAGLGYNRRALNLHRAAVATVERFNGHLPTDPLPLATLPGIGSYTAAAIACFAAGARVAVLDTNIARVIARSLLGAATPRDTTPATLTAAATAYLPARNARHHNLALMDLGATICTARMPYCPACPLQGDCAYRAAGCPAPSPRRARTPRFESTARYARGRIIDALRTGPQTADALAALLPEAHRESLPRYLAALQRDGLITHSEGAWHLPK